MNIISPQNNLIFPLKHEVFTDTKFRYASCSQQSTGAVKIHSHLMSKKQFEAHTTELLINQQITHPKC